MQGICRLCLKTRELQDSHLSPKSLYKSVLRARTPYDSAPVMIDYIENTAVRKNDQFSQHLLCAACEQILNTGGENFVNKNCFRAEGQFPLRDKLERITASTTNEQGLRSWMTDRPLDRIDVPALEHFACGYLWKWSVAEGGPGGWGLYKGALGDVYTEQFRQYLLGEAEFPTRAHVRVLVDFDEPSSTGLSSPACQKETISKFKMNGHQFMIPGMQFTVLLGGDTRRFVRACQGDTVASTTIFEWSATRSGYNRRQESETKKVSPKGKLANSG